MLSGRWWIDSFSARASRAMVVAMGAFVAKHSQFTVSWACPNSRPTVFVLVGDRSTDDVSEQLRLLVRANPEKNLDFVVLGGGDELRAALRAFADDGAMRPLGLAHVDERSSLWIDYLDPLLDRAMRDEFERDDFEPVDYESLAKQHDEGREVKLDASAELATFNAKLSRSAPVVTYALLALIVAVFALEMAFRLDSLSTLVRVGALSRERVVRGSELHRLLSYSFVHGSVNHLVMNALSLFSLGAFYERLLGRGRFSVIYALSALVGALASLAFSKSGYVVGASGAIFGFIGASVALALKPLGSLPESMIAGFRRNAMVNVAVQLFVSMLPNVSLAAHAGGFLVGFALVYSGLAHPKDSPIEERDAVWRRTGAAMLGAMVLCGALGVGLGRVWKRDDTQSWQRYSLAAGVFVRAPQAPVLERSADATRTEWTVARFDSAGFQAGILFRAFDERATDEQLEELMHGWLREREGLAHPADSTPLGEPRRGTGSAVRRVDQRFRKGEQGRFRTVMIADPRGTLSLQVLYRASDEPVVDRAVEAMVQSLLER
jgi:rhomboid protease GluP